MSTRTLLAYFDDVRKGRKDIALVQQLLMEIYHRDPVMRGHLLNWLDQAQYEHPIPVTDFLILRKEVETAMKDSKPRPADDDATVIAGSIAPDAPTLVATAITTQTAEATLVANPGTHPDSSGDLTPLPERSDHVGRHDAANTLRPAEMETVIAPPPPPPARSRFRSRNLLLTSAAAIAALIAIATVLTLTGTSTGKSVDKPSDPSALQSPTESATPPLQNANPTPAAATAPAETLAPTRDLTSLTQQALQQELQRRLQQGQLLPTAADHSAHAILRELDKRFPDDPQLQARIAIKNAHLQHSDQAREKGDWEQAQQHLDAAFEVLQQAVE